MSPGDSSHFLADDPFYHRVKAYVIASTGLAYYNDRDLDFARILEGRLTELGLDTCSSYLERLMDQEGGAAERDALISQLTIGETYFFRHGEQFDALRAIVLPDILSRKQSTRELRIWSAGCATGAEAYSLAILLRRELADRTNGWRVNILGTDINQEFLKQARHGTYGEWAFRSTAEDVKRACFSRANNAWEIAPEYKDSVSFRYHNLATDPFPSMRDGICDFDLILCRNVTIYFDREVTGRIVTQFSESLDLGGWLMVGHAEHDAETFRAFRSVNAEGITLYKKDAPPTFPAGLSAAASACWNFTLPAHPDTQSKKQVAGNGRQPPRAANGVAPARVQLSDADLAELRGLADRGEWGIAAGRCRELLSRDRLNPVVHFYHGLIREETGGHAEAAHSYRQAIYLDRNFVLAHYHLGLALQREKQYRQAARSFENVLRILSRWPAAQTLAEGGGLTAAGLKELTRTHLEVAGG